MVYSKRDILRTQHIAAQTIKTNDSRLAEDNDAKAELHIIDQTDQIYIGSCISNICVKECIKKEKQTNRILMAKL